MSKLTLEEERIFIRRQLFFDWRLKNEIEKTEKKHSARPTDETLKRDSMIKKRPEIYYQNIVLCQINLSTFI